MLCLQVLDRVLRLSVHDSPVNIPQLRLGMNELLKQTESLSKQLGQHAEASLPNVYEMVFQHALSFSRGAAADELMGNYARSHELYGKALDLLWFLAKEAPQIGLEPQVVFSEEETSRLRSYMLTVNARRAACSALGTQ